MNRYRLQYSKTGEIRFTGNLDIQKIFERSFRRAQISISYSQGFHPQAKIVQASPLPLGFQGTSELMDIWIEHKLSATLISVLNKSLPIGLRIKKYQMIIHNERSLPSRMYASLYVIEVEKNIHFQSLKNSIELFLSQQEYIIERNNKTLDIRHMVEKMNATQKEEKIEIFLQISSLPSKTGRPENILQILNIDPACTLITRTELLYR